MARIGRMDTNNRSLTDRQTDRQTSTI